MDVFELLDKKINEAIHHLERLINEYHSTSDIDREKFIQQSGAVFDLIESYLNVEDNLLYPPMLERGLLKPEYSRARALQQEMEANIERSVLIHVDEPSCEFKENLLALLALTVKYRQLDIQDVFPVMKSHLTETDLKVINENVQKELLHEGKAELILNTV